MVHWSRKIVPDTKRAAVFWTDCSRFITVSAVHVSTALQ